MNNKNLFNSKSINTISIIVILVIIVIVVIKILNPSTTTDPITPTATPEQTLSEEVFRLNGGDVIINYKGDYIEQGCTYIDKYNHDLSHTVKIINNIDTKIPGTYKVIYQYNDKTLYRNVTVLEPSDTDIEIKYSLSKEELTNKNITINYEVIGEFFSQIDLPNGEKNNNSKGSFEVSKNGSYIIKAYNTKGQLFQKEIQITNILKDKPEGSCTLTVYNSGSKIEVTVKNSEYIKGYKYYYGSNKTEILSSSSYVIKTKNKKAGVTIYDKAGNSSNVTCTTIDKTSTPTPKPTSTPKQSDVTISYDTRSYTQQTYNGVSYMLYKPSNNINGKIPLVVYYHGAAGLSIGLPKDLQSGANLPYYIICPINNTSTSFAPSLISYLVNYLNIDTKRIYISGASAGTKPAINTAYQNQGLFAGAIIIASYQDTPNLNVGVPMWFFQGSNDNYNYVKSIVNNINNSGGQAKLTTYPGGHDAPLSAFTRQDLNNWILKK